MGGRKNDSRFSHVRELTYLLNAVLAIIFSSEVKLECPTPSRDDSIEIEVVYEMAQTKKKLDLGMHHGGFTHVYIKKNISLPPHNALGSR